MKLKLTIISFINWTRRRDSRTWRTFRL